MEGKTLTSIIKQRGTLPEKTVISILIQLLRELKRDHAQGLLLYPAIEPDNIIWQSGNRVSVYFNFCPLKGASSHIYLLTGKLPKQFPIDLGLTVTSFYDPK